METSMTLIQDTTLPQELQLSLFALKEDSKTPKLHQLANLALLETTAIRLTQQSAQKLRHLAQKVSSAQLKLDTLEGTPARSVTSETDQVFYHLINARLALRNSTAPRKA